MLVMLPLTQQEPILSLTVDIVLDKIGQMGKAFVLELQNLMTDKSYAILIVPVTILRISQKYQKYKHSLPMASYLLKLCDVLKDSRMHQAIILPEVIYCGEDDESIYS